MYRRTTPVIERMVVRIDDVDLPKRIVHVRDKTNSLFKAGFRATATTFQIPNPGELWIVQRMSSTEWHLMDRWDKQEEHDSKTALQYGDAQTRVPGTLYLHAEGIQIASKAFRTAPKPLGATNREYETYTAPLASYTLQRPTVSTETLHIYHNGLLLFPGVYSVAADMQTITFSPSLNTSPFHLVIHYQAV